MTVSAAFSSNGEGSAKKNHDHNRPKLELVFDINKTILIDDPAGGKSEFKLLNEIISENAWGKDDFIIQIRGMVPAFGLTSLSRPLTHYIHTYTRYCKAFFQKRST